MILGTPEIGLPERYSFMDYLSTARRSMSEHTHEFDQRILRHELRLSQSRARNSWKPLSLSMVLSTCVKPIDTAQVHRFQSSNRMGCWYQPFINSPSPLLLLGSGTKFLNPKPINPTVAALKLTYCRKAAQPILFKPPSHDSGFRVKVLRSRIEGLAFRGRGKVGTSKVHPCSLSTADLGSAN